MTNKVAANIHEVLEKPQKINKMRKTDEDMRAEAYYKSGNFPVLPICKNLRSGIIYCLALYYDILEHELNEGRNFRHT